MPDDTSRTTIVRPSGPWAALRVAVVLACLAYIWLSPAPKQLFGRPSSDYLRMWVMFSGAGLEVTEVRYVRVDNGVETQITRAELTEAGIPEPKRGRFTSEDEAVRIAKRMCREYGADADVRASVRVATRQGWKRTRGGKTNICGGGGAESSRTRLELP